MVSLEKVPVIEVNTDNIVHLWPAILQAVQSATFIAIDTELSGLGNRRLLNAKAIDERYRHMCEVAGTRSMVALGISCFKLLPHSDAEVCNTDGKRQRLRKLYFQVQTYNVMLLCSEHYVVEPGSLRFLVEHGFDFNLQYAKGLPYRRGNDKV
ncbi:hypothetical protein LSH36_127g16051 [Paralvinella palmiformis]|uniref:Uncharacterized protein n=1 Tax=Paralvinella palmiformis TaxID=53620 RepID=A0AAD9N8I9_9ANNE|nr:hypothetical protein LSH36_127g16051 [Paralvinella palmiformis]